jgi:anti-anti-sigma factor
MSISKTLVDGILILSPGPKLTASVTGEALSQAVKEELDKGIEKVLFDFSEVEFIDSLGVGQIVSSYRMITDAGGRLILCGLGPRVLTVLRLANLHTVLDIREMSSSEIHWQQGSSQT